MAEINLHDGHRKRLKSEFVELGVDSFSDIRALELLLFYAIPRRDTNLLAHALLDRFGSLYGVFSASREELMSVDGIAENTAIFLRLVPEIQRKAELEEEKRVQKKMDSSIASGNIAVHYLKKEKNERFLLFCLDSQKKIIRVESVSVGVVNRVNVDIRRVAELVLCNHSCSVILAHNHPDGDIRPSEEDVNLTHAIINALNILGVSVLDHIIVGQNEYYSFADAGII